MSFRHWLSGLALTALLVGSGTVWGQAEKKSPKELSSFGTLRTPTPEAARGQAQDWLKGVGKTDDTNQKAFNAIWEQDRPVLDRVAATLELGDPQAKKILEEARDAAAPAPTAVPAPISGRLFLDCGGPR